MRQWTPSPYASRRSDLMVDLIDAVGLPGFAPQLLDRLCSIVPAGSLSVYRTGPGCRPRRFMGASRRTPDTTRDCWRAYMSGPWLSDRTLSQDGPADPGTPGVFHITAAEVPPEHRAKVYEAHGIAERVSVARMQPDNSVFAVNFYRHADQRALRESELADFAMVAPELLAITQKHLAFLGIETGSGVSSLMSRGKGVREQLLAGAGTLTPRELDVCERLLRGMTHQAIATDMKLGLPTVRTYRNRAFNRLGIHLTSELFALARAQETPRS